MSHYCVNEMLSDSLKHQLLRKVTGDLMFAAFINRLNRRVLVNADVLGVGTAGMEVAA